MSQTSSSLGTGRGMGLSGDYQYSTIFKQYKEMTSRPLRALNIQHHVHCLLHLYNAIRSIIWADWAHIDSHSLPRCIEELVTIQ